MSEILYKEENYRIIGAINYLNVSQNKLALIVNFGELKLNYKRIIK